MWQPRSPSSCGTWACSLPIPSACTRSCWQPRAFSSPSRSSRRPCWSCPSSCTWVAAPSRTRISSPWRSSCCGTCSGASRCPPSRTTSRSTPASRGTMLVTRTPFAVFSRPSCRSPRRCSSHALTPQARNGPSRVSCSSLSTTPSYHRIISRPGSCRCAHVASPSRPLVSLPCCKDYDRRCTRIPSDAVNTSMPWRLLRKLETRSTQATVATTTVTTTTSRATPMTASKLPTPSICTQADRLVMSS
mmetsp:Transcript_22210/g.61845  ORF Transcript_22210/g.61845 Transcript_22210/m.61845 type:complete len:246 (+) Transcript_22210:516-1253(+)